jgi:hypothetical protein
VKEVHSDKAADILLYGRGYWLKITRMYFTAILQVEGPNKGFRCIKNFNINPSSQYVYLASPFWFSKLVFEGDVKHGARTACVELEQIFLPAEFNWKQYYPCVFWRGEFGQRLLLRFGSGCSGTGRSDR